MCGSYGYSHSQGEFMCAMALSCPTNTPPLIRTVFLEVPHLAEGLLVIDGRSGRDHFLQQ